MNLNFVGWISAAHPPSRGGCATLIHPTRYENFFTAEDAKDAEENPMPLLFLCVLRVLCGENDFWLRQGAAL